MKNGEEVWWLFSGHVDRMPSFLKVTVTAVWECGTVQVADVVDGRVRLRDAPSAEIFADENDARRRYIEALRRHIAYLKTVLGNAEIVLEGAERKAAKAA